MSREKGANGLGRCQLKILADMIRHGHGHWLPQWYLSWENRRMLGTLEAQGLVVATGRASWKINPDTVPELAHLTAGKPR